MNQLTQFGHDLRQFMRGLDTDAIADTEETGVIPRGSKRDDLSFIFVRHPGTGREIGYEWSPESDEDTLVLQNTKMLPDGFPLTTRLHIDRGIFQPLSVVRVDESRGDRKTTYALHYDPMDETGENVRITGRATGGPGRNERTYSCVVRDIDSEEEYEMVAASISWVGVVIVGAMVVCAGLIIEESIREDCAEKCIQTCGGRGRVKMCSADVVAGFKWGNGMKIGCSHSCKSKCKSGSSRDDGGSDGDGGDDEDGYFYVGIPPIDPGRIDTG